VRRGRKATGLFREKDGRAAEGLNPLQSRLFVLGDIFLPFSHSFLQAFLCGANNRVIGLVISTQTSYPRRKEVKPGCLNEKESKIKQKELFLYFAKLIGDKREGT